LEVRIKATPGREAYFDIEDVASDIPMKELPAKEAGGLEGIYVGRYTVKENDAANNVHIRFHIPKNFFSNEKAFSKSTVTMTPHELPRVAEVIGKRPYFNAGLGADRLGGAKLGFISPGVKVTVIGKVGDQYKIHLGETMIGWLPEEFAKLLPQETPLPHALTSSISVTGNGNDDIVNLILTDKVPYTSEQLVSPAAIVVNVYGASSNTNWVTQHLSAENIEQVKWTQVSAEQFQLYITLKQKQHWGYDIAYEGSSLRIKIKRAPKIQDIDKVLKGLKIAIDAGHGGDNNGAIGATGIKEKDVNLSIARHLDSLLKTRGVLTMMTRDSDLNISMTERTDKILSFNPTILVSVHSNSTGETADPENAKGTGVFYRYSGFKSLSDILYSKMLELGLAQFGVTGGFNFSLNAPTQMVNVLVETAFLSNPEDEMKLMDDGFRQRIAGKITEGLEEFVVKSKK
ncbi:MAG: N-acetylmuramoyl-L-alanine amidase, partial [Bacteroidota bacterium]|nr:N-acetylmuramoyl-L-alanine amidase [Bacteroidota bacterium]